MGRKKKEVVETVSVKEKEEVKPTCIETKIFSIKATADVKLRKLPSISDASDNIQGKLKKGDICSVICEINYTPVKMYKLSNGYYVIASQNIQII